MLNVLLWDSCLTYEGYSFKGNTRSVNPRNFLQQSKDINYELDSEDELEERLGEDADSQDSDDSDFFSQNPKEDDHDLVDEGWIVPDD